MLVVAEQAMYPARISLPALPTYAGFVWSTAWRRPAYIEGSYPMTTSSESALFAVDQGPTPVDADSDGFQLDVRIVEADPVAAALLGDTDNGCDTVRGSDC